MSRAIEYARDLAEAGDLDDAMRLVMPMLEEDPNDADPLNIYAYCLLKADKLVLAYHLGKRATEINPTASVWNAFGMICNELQRWREAETAFNKALNRVKDEHTKKLIYLNMGARHTDRGEFSQARKCFEKILEIDPDHLKAKGNMGFCQLAERDWANGWKNYHKVLGMPSRRKVQYGDEPEWQGEKGNHVVVYGEQGLGDEICFASIVPDAAEACEKLVLDVDPRLKGLFQRSFPDVKVYGTRGDNKPIWNKEDINPDYSLALGQLGEYFRLTDESFHGKPYLVPDPDRVMMWKSLFKTKNKPVIGIAWSGGIKRTGSRLRYCPLEDWLPMFESIDAHWVSLQYKPAQKQIDRFKKNHPWVDIVEYPYATLTDDYDDTAGLVAALDCVVSVPTAVWHLSGAMGVPLVAMKSQFGCWKAQAGLPFHPVMHFVDFNRNWKETIKDAIPYVENLCEPYLSESIQDSHSRTTSCVTASNGTHQNLSMS